MFDTLNEEQKTVVYALIGQALENADIDEEDEDEDEDEKDNNGGNTMKHNTFDNDMTFGDDDVLTHADQMEIINLAKNKSGSLKNALDDYFGDDVESLQHSIGEIESLFPDYRDVKPGAPEVIRRDDSWVKYVMDNVHKTPFSRIRTKQNDIRTIENAVKGFKKGAEKKSMGNSKLIKRTTDPQTVFVRDTLNRDDIIDITDFDVVNYQYDVMRSMLEESVATAILIGDGREDGDADKIDETHIRPIWQDDDIYTIHTTVDIDAARKELQGSNTAQTFGENYIYAEAIISAALYSREQYRGNGTPAFFCTPHILNVMLLARDLNGRRIYQNRNDLVAALNVSEIYTVEQFEGRTRKTSDSAPKTMELLGLFVNLNNYDLGSTKGGEITKFSDFDIKFNSYEYLIETRLSGAMTKAYAAIALEIEKKSPAAVNHA